MPTHGKPIGTTDALHATTIQSSQRRGQQYEPDKLRALQFYCNVEILKMQEYTTEHVTN